MPAAPPLPSEAQRAAAPPDDDDDSDDGAAAAAPQRPSLEHRTSSLGDARRRSLVGRRHSQSFGMTWWPVMACALQSGQNVLTRSHCVMQSAW